MWNTSINGEVRQKVEQAVRKWSKVPTLMIVPVGPHIRDRSEGSRIPGRDGSVAWQVGNRDCKWKWLFVSGFECSVTRYMIWIYMHLDRAEK